MKSLVSALTLLLVTSVAFAQNEQPNVAILVFILARAGLLDGLQATTTAPLVDALGELAPTTKVVHGLPFVDNGKIITSAGLSSGLDAALHVFGRVHGMEAARKKAARLEYDWDESGLIVRR